MSITSVLFDSCATLRSPEDVGILRENISPLSSVGTCMEDKRQTLVLL
jgi:hypothetical protein